MKHKCFLALLLLILCQARGQFLLPPMQIKPVMPTPVITLPAIPVIPIPVQPLPIPTVTAVPGTQRIGNGICTIPISKNNISKRFKDIQIPSVKAEEIKEDNQEKVNKGNENEEEGTVEESKNDETAGKGTAEDDWDGVQHSIMPPIPCLHYKDDNETQVVIEEEHAPIKSANIANKVEDIYEVIFRCNPLTWSKDGYEIDRSKQLGGTVKKVLYVLILTDKHDNTTFVAVSFLVPTQNLAHLGIPKSGSPILQTIVDDLDIVTNSSNLKAGHFEHGSIEFWPFNYGPHKKLGLPDASDETCDFDDTPSTDGNYTSMQIHNYMEKQVIMAINKPHAGFNGELGIGNNTDMPPRTDPSKKPNPDWTNTNSACLYKSAVLIVAGQFSKDSDNDTKDLKNN